MAICKRLVDLFRSTLHESQVWFETGYQLHDRMLQPDMSVSWPGQRVENDWFQGSPMIAVEVASRGNTAEEMEGKVAAYLEEPAAEVWVIYPKHLTMTVFRNSETLRIRELYLCDTLGLEINVRHLLQPVVTQ